jgi:hypothetical protein
MSSVTSLRAPGTGPQHIAVGTAETDRQLTDSTRLMYSADMAAFTAWCASAGRRPLPAAPETVTEYVAHLTVTPSPQTGRPLTPGSINRVLTAVRAAHRADARTMSVDGIVKRSTRPISAVHGERPVGAGDPFSFKRLGADGRNVRNLRVTRP